MWLPRALSALRERTQGVVPVWATLGKCPPKFMAFQVIKVCFHAKMRSFDSQDPSGLMPFLTALNFGRNMSKVGPKDPYWVKKTEQTRKDMGAGARAATNPVVPLLLTGLGTCFASFQLRPRVRAVQCHCHTCGCVSSHPPTRPSSGGQGRQYTWVCVRARPSSCRRVRRRPALGLAHVQEGPLAAVALEGEVTLVAVQRPAVVRLWARPPALRKP